METLGSALKAIPAVLSQVNTQTCKQLPLSSTEQERYDLNANIERVLHARGVPERFVKAQLDRPEKLDVESGYFFYGPCGSGKTYKAVAVMREILMRKSNPYRIADIVRGIYDARFISVTSLLLRIKASFVQDAQETDRELIERVAGHSFLVLDDIGTEKITDWTLQTLYTIIDIRSRENKQTIVTSNLSIDELAAKMNDRIASRIAGMCKPAPISGKDRRIA
jgi:DNA replication protein DnaC